ncbi:phage tail tape measure protein [Faecalimonas sp. LCP19S3_D12]
MAKKKIGAYITLDGEKEFRSAVSSCNKNLATMKSEMKLVEAQTAGSANTLDTLKRKHEVLSNTLEEQMKKEEAVRIGLKHAEQQYEKVGKELAEYKEQLQKAQDAINEMEKASDASGEELKKQAELIESLSKAVEKGEATYQRAGNRVQDWKKQLNNAESQTIRATKAVKENESYLLEAEKATDKCAKSIDNFGEKTDKTVSELTKFSTLLKTDVKRSLIETGKELGKDLFSSAVQGTLELQDAQNQLRASTGTAAEATKEYNAQMQELYKGGYADSVNDVANAMALVKQYTNETNPTKIKELAENGIALQDVFEMDLSESIRGIDALMDNMGLSAEQAFDYMAAGAQNGLDKSGELADNIAEYSQLWGQAGFSAEEMFSILQNGLDSGAYNLDKINDYVKEFGISLADGRIEENINAFSVETQGLFQQWKNGEVTTKQVFQSVISDLASTENQQQALTIASNTWSSLGEDNAMKVITSLNNVNNTYKNVHGTMEDIKKIKYDSVSNQWKMLGRTFQTDVMQPILVKFLPTAQKGMKALADNIETIVPIATTTGAAVGTIFVINKSKKFIGEVKEAGKTVADFGKELLKFTGIKTAETAADVASTAAKGTQTAATVAQTAATAAQATVTTTATAAQEGLNMAMAVNPIGIIVAGIGLAVGALTVFSSVTDEASEKADVLGEKTEEVNKKIEKSSNELSKSFQEMKTSMSSISAKETVAEDLVDELYKLEKASKKTSGQISRMDMIVRELNTMFPELSLSVDKNTGALNKNEQQTKSSIETSLKFAKVQAAQEKMTDITKKMVEADLARVEAESNLNDIGEKLKDLENEKNQIMEKSEETMKKGISSYVEYNGQMIDSQEALMRISESENALLETKEKQEEKLTSLNEKYNEANEKYETAYEYTESLTDATIKNTESVQKNVEAKQAAQEVESTSIEMAGQELEAYNSLSSAQQEMAANVTNAVLTMQESVQGALESQMNMFERFDGGVQISTETLLSNMQSQIDGVTQWEQNLSALAEKGINQGILQKLAEMGPEGSGYVQAFNNMTSEEIAKANELWNQSIDIRGMTNEWGQQLLTSGAENIAGGIENLTPIMQQSGANTVIGLVQGMQRAQKMSEAAGKDLGVKTIESVNNGLGVHSPSIKMKESGKNVNLGLVLGMHENKEAVQEAAKGVAVAATQTISTILDKRKFEGYGRNISQGLAQGIASGKSVVISAATNVAEESIRAAKRALDINSPSRKFRKLGHGTIEGYVVGIQEKASMVKKTVTSALHFGDLERNIDTRNGNIAERENRKLVMELGNIIRQMKVNTYLNGRELTRGLSDLGVVFRDDL